MSEKRAKRNRQKERFYAGVDRLRSLGLRVDAEYLDEDALRQFCIDNNIPKRKFCPHCDGGRMHQKQDGSAEWPDEYYCAKCSREMSGDEYRQLTQPT